MSGEAGELEDRRHCRACGQDLSGVSYRVACPGCGAPVVSQLDPDAMLMRLPPPAITSGPILTDVPCVSCGYTLRGLDAQGQCPECGTAAANSLRGGYLRLAGVDYLRSLKRGFTWVEWGLIIRATCIGAVVALGFGQQSITAGVALVLGVVAVAASTWGWWQITIQHTLVGRHRSRLWSRWTMVMGNALEVSLFTSATGQTPSASNIAGLVVPGAACFFNGAFMLLWLFSIVAQLYYLHALARALPERGLASLSSTATWLTPVLAIAALPMAVACPFVTPLVWIGTFVFYFVVVDRARSVFSGAWAAAEFEVRLQRAGERGSESHPSQGDQPGV